MRSEVKVVFDAGQQFRFELDEAPSMPRDQALAWLDGEFTRLDCEPLRPTGKLLLADKVLVVAQAAGPALLGDAQWGPAFAQAASVALARPLVRVDVAAMAVTY